MVARRMATNVGLEDRAAKTRNGKLPPGAKALGELVSYLTDVFDKNGMAGVGEALSSVAEELEWSERRIWARRVTRWVRNGRKSPDSVLNADESHVRTAERRHSSSRTGRSRNGSRA